MNNWTEQREREIRERLQAATPGPWDSEPDDEPECYWVFVDDGEGGGETVASCALGEFSGRDDADLIAHAPQDLADALDEIARLRAALRAVNGDMTDPDQSAA
ncbi:hypothetical protein QT614_22475 [Xanthomonas citri pv. citri]